jgi:replicative DNA helicase
MQTPIESERGIASITLNNPELVLNAVSDAGFNPAFIADLVSRYVVEVVLDQVSRRAVCDVRIVFEQVREKLPEFKFHELTELYTLMPIPSALRELMEIVKQAAKRRALAAILSEGQKHLEAPDVSTAELVNTLHLGIEKVRGELNPPAVLDTKALIMDAITRYQEGDDTTQRIRTGYEKLDNLTPIRYGDFLVIGGPEKSGKTMLAINIIANILNEPS